jgi:dephospho-CoA kinase
MLITIVTGTANEGIKSGKKGAAELMKELEVDYAQAEKVGFSRYTPQPKLTHYITQAYSIATADLSKATKTAAAGVVREKEAKMAEAKAKVSSLSAELARASKRAKAEL